MLKPIYHHFFTIFPNCLNHKADERSRFVNQYFAGWEGPRRPEFREGLDMAKFTGNQKWQMWCLERWLDMNEGR